MQIQAANLQSNMVNCQPIQPVSFTKKQYLEALTDPIYEQDSFTSNQLTLEQKYDLACLLAAFYKKQDDELIKVGYVVA